MSKELIISLVIGVSLLAFFIFYLGSKEKKVLNLKESSKFLNLSGVISGLGALITLFNFSAITSFGFKTKCIIFVLLVLQCLILTASYINNMSKIIDKAGVIACLKAMGIFYVIMVVIGVLTVVSIKYYITMLLFVVTSMVVYISVLFLMVSICVNIHENTFKYYKSIDNFFPIIVIIVGNGVLGLISNIITTSLK